MPINYIVVTQAKSFCTAGRLACCNVCEKQELLKKRINLCKVLFLCCSFLDNL